MKKLIVLFISLTMFYSCIREYETMTYYTFENKTDFNIKLIAKRSNPTQSIIIDSVSLIESNKKIEFFYYEDGENQVSRHPFGKLIPEAKVIFNDSLEIYYHYDDGNPRNILHFENFEGGNVRTGVFEFTYTFTEKDYNNAVPIKE